MMLLSSIDRVMQYTGLIDASGDDPVKRRSVQIWLPTISKRIEQYLNRELEIKSYTDYFDSREDVIEYTPQATPVNFLQSVYASAMGLYTGEEYVLINYYIGRFNQSIALNYPVNRWRKGLRAIYRGGLAYHGTYSTVAVKTVVGTWTVGDYVTTSQACGTVVSMSAASNYMVIDNLYGLFSTGDALVEKETEFTVGGADGTATISRVNTDPTLHVFAINNITGTWTVGKYVKGQTSSCVGTITAVNTESIEIRPWYTGSEMSYFSVGETIVEQDSATAVGSSTGTAVITAIIMSGLAESFPEIVLACEGEMRFMLKHQYDYENQGTYKDQTSRRPDKVEYSLQPETRALLEVYRRYLV